MKSTLVLSVAIAVFGTLGTATAQTTAHHHSSKSATEAPNPAPKPVTPPDSVSTAFQARFSGATPAWQITPAGNYCAMMDNNGQKVYAEFGPDGKWLRTRTDVEAAKLPDSARNAIQTQFPGMEIAAVQKLEYENVNPFYRVDLKQGDQMKSIMVNDAGYVQQ